MAATGKVILFKLDIQLQVNELYMKNLCKDVPKDCKQTTSNTNTYSNWFQATQNTGLCLNVDTVVAELRLSFELRFNPGPLKNHSQEIWILF